MDKAIQCPPIEENSPSESVVHKPTGICTGDDGVEYDQFHKVVKEKPAHSSSFNMINETIRKNLPKCSTKLPDLKRSGILFEGKTCVREFIVQVEDYFLYRNFDESVLVGAFSELLSGTAAKWFRANRFFIGSWLDLKVALLKRFDKCDFDYFLEHDLRTRKQKYNESLPDFITEILDMSNRLSNPLLESTLINIIKHNMLPIYTPYILGKDIISLDFFTAFGKELEPLVDRKPFKVPVKNFKFEKSYSSAVKSTVTCLKCGEIGHSFKNCFKIPGIICFKCKKLGVTTKDCEACALAKNSSTIPKN